MSSARYIGRVGGLAVALGVGAAVLSNAAVAAAEPESSGSAGTEKVSAMRAAAPAKSTQSKNRPARAARTPARRPAPVSAASSAGAPVRPASTRANRALLPEPPAVAAVEPGAEPDPTATAHADPVPPRGAVAVPARSSAPHRAGIFARPAAAGALAAQSAPGSVTPPQHLIKLVFTGMLQLAVAASMTTINFAPPSPTTPTPTLVLNGYTVVPNAPETVVSHYGRWSYFPGGLSMVQGEQQFALVDPVSGDQVGTFDALVTKGVGYNYVQLLVKPGDAANVGAGAGQVPPAGSLISAMNLGRFGWSYTSLPEASGNRVTFALRTPFGEFPVPLTFDAAAGIADRTVDNRPVDLANGYRIAPVQPAGETLTAITGLLPIFGTVQGNQVFGVYDADGNMVGSFEGVFTTTSDLALNYTQAILVTASDGANVGTAAGQAPPVGSVYNIIYTGSFDDYILYSSLPSPSGDVVSIVEVVGDRVSNVTPTFINASRQPEVKPLSTPEGYTFVPASPLVPSGVNGLPPREVEIQGYQQFDVYDASGSRIGRVDADVTTQWDMFGIYSQAILITDVTEGATAVPPAGSIFNFAQYFKGALGTAHSTVPTQTADVTSFAIRTPLGDIAFPRVSRPANDRTDVTFFSPFRTV